MLQGERWGSSGYVPRSECNCGPCIVFGKRWKIPLSDIRRKGICCSTRQAWFKTGTTYANFLEIKERKPSEAVFGPSYVTENGCPPGQRSYKGSTRLFQKSLWVIEDSITCSQRLAGSTTTANSSTSFQSWHTSKQSRWLFRSTQAIQTSTG